MSETNNFRIVKRKEYQVLSIIDSNDEYESFHVQRKGKDFTCTSYRNENDFNRSQEVYNSLRRYGIDAPKQLLVDKKKMEIITPYYPTGNMAKYLSANEMDDKLWEEIFRVYRFCRFSKVNINYLPENFVLVKKTLLYTGKELNQYSDDANFENWGMQFWFNCQIRENHLEQLGYELPTRPILRGAEMKKQMVMTAIKFW